jgi:aldose 1-epimerase
MFKVENISHKNPLLNKLIITNDAFRLKSIIYPNLGASLQQLNIKNTKILNGITDDENGIETYKNMFNSAFLFPFPNRIELGKYSFEDENYQLFCNESTLNNAIHGHIFNKSFKIKNIEASETKASIILNYDYKGNIDGFPFPYKLSIIYKFERNKITVAFNVLNNGKNTFPFGIGWHPYLNSNNLAESELNFNGKFQYKLSDKMIPISKHQFPFKMPFKINDISLDDCFISENQKISLATKTTHLEINFKSVSKSNYLQIYTPPNRKSIAIEPMTCAPNCFNNKDGMLKLAPNKTFNWAITLNYNLK